MDKDKHKAKELRQVRFGATPEKKLGFAGGTGHGTKSH